MMSEKLLIWTYLWHDRMGLGDNGIKLLPSEISHNCFNFICR